MNLKPVWYIERQVFDPQDYPLHRKALENNNCDIVYLDYEDRFDLSKKIIEDRIGIFHGSINTSKAPIKDKQIFPWTWIDWNALKCSSYYVGISDLLLNGDSYVFVPWGELKSNYSRIYDQIGGFTEKENLVDSVFIRPDTNDKLFSGKCITYPNFEHFWKQENDCYSPDPQALALIARPQIIEKEIRGIVIEHKLISLTGYGDGLIIPTEEMYEKCSMVVEELKNRKFLPTMPAYTIDFSVDNDFKIVEVGSLNTSAWYDCDYNKIIRATNELALREYEDLK